MDKLKLDLSDIVVQSLETGPSQAVQARITIMVNCASLDGCSDFCTPRQTRGECC